jgi:magnesium-transporting ATPase (P-type)
MEMKNLKAENGITNEATADENKGAIAPSKSVRNLKNPRQVKPRSGAEKKLDNDFSTNRITTARYTIWSFLPLSIIIQFTKIANVAWLGVMILNSIPAVRVNSPLVVAIVLGIIIFIGVLKEGITDYARHQQDKRTNNTPVKKVGNLKKGTEDHIVKTKLMDVKVGDILYLEDRQIIPADCVVLKVENDQGTDEGFIQTA